MSLYSMMFIGMGPIGALIAGVAAARVGAPWTVAVGGSLCIVGGTIFARLLPSLRGEARQLISEQAIAVADPATSVSLPD